MLPPQPPDGSGVPATWRQRGSTALLVFGWCMVFFGLATAFSGFGFPFLLFAPAPFLLGAWLAPSVPRIAHAALIVACWFVGLAVALT